MDNVILIAIGICAIIYAVRSVWNAFHKVKRGCSTCEGCAFKDDCCDPNAPKPIIKEVRRNNE